MKYTSMVLLLTVIGVLNCAPEHAVDSNDKKSVTVHEQESEAGIIDTINFDAQNTDIENSDVNVDHDQNANDAGVDDHDVNRDSGLNDQEVLDSQNNPDSSVDLDAGIPDIHFNLDSTVEVDIGLENDATIPLNPACEYDGESSSQISVSARLDEIFHKYEKSY